MKGIRVVGLFLIGAAALFWPGAPAASAYSTAAGYAATAYVTGLPEVVADSWGPIGIAFDQSDNLYVSDAQDANIYRFQPGGGTADSNTRLTSSPIYGGIAGLAFSRSGALYAALHSAGEIVQIDPDTGSVLRTVAEVPCPLGLAVDPVSGDLFASDQCDSTIFRISNYASGMGTVTSYASAPHVDGIAFDNSGALYAEASWNILEIGGTNSSSPGQVSNVANVPTADGVAFGAHQSGQPSFLVTNDNNGTVTRVDFGQGPPSENQIFTGGTRGDFAAVDSEGCLYITQSASIVRISGGQQCAFEPTTGGSRPPAGIVVSVLGASTTTIGRRTTRGAACVAAKSLTLRVRQKGRVRLRSVSVYVNGKLVKRLSGTAAQGPIVIRRLPRGPFTVKVIARTTRGKRLMSSHRYANCGKAKPVRHRAKKRHRRHRKTRRR